jgi:hypothetical protein
MEDYQMTKKSRRKKMGKLFSQFAVSTDLKHKTQLPRMPFRHLLWPSSPTVCQVDAAENFFLSFKSINLPSIGAIPIYRIYLL